MKSLMLAGIRESEVKYMMTSMELLPKLQRLLPDLADAGLQTIIFAPSPAPRSQPSGASSVETAAPAPKLDKFCTHTIDELIRLGEANSTISLSRPSRDDLSFIVYTSGTTGVSPFVICQH